MTRKRWNICTSIFFILKFMINTVWLHCEQYYGLVSEISDMNTSCYYRYMSWSTWATFHIARLVCFEVIVLCGNKLMNRIVWYKNFIEELCCLVYFGIILGIMQNVSMYRLAWAIYQGLASRMVNFFRIFDNDFRVPEKICYSLTEKHICYSLTKNIYFPWPRTLLFLTENTFAIPWPRKFAIP